MQAFSARPFLLLPQHNPIRHLKRYNSSESGLKPEEIPGFLQDQSPSEFLLIAVGGS
jgi:hypothetical protein